MLGDLTADLTLAVDRFPREGEDAFATYRRMSTGGFGANVGIVLARLGHRPRLISNVGDDDWGRLAVETLVRHGVDVTAVARDRSAPTHLTLIVVSANGERTMVGHRGASGYAGSLPTLDHGPPGPPAALVMSGYALFGGERLAQARQAIRSANLAGLPVVLDLPTELPEAVQVAVREVLDQVRILVVGGAEICRLTGRADPAGAAESLCAAGRTVVVTLGAGGCLAVECGTLVQIPALRVDPVDTAGAGDALVAALTAAWLDGLGLPDALALANCFGAAATLLRGTGTAMPGPDDVRDLISGAESLSADALAWLSRVPGADWP